MASVLAYAGNRVDSPGTSREAARFPSSRAEAVRRDVRDVLERECPDAIVGAAAAGADLIVVEEGLALGIDVHLVLPLTPASFRASSVADRGEQWGLAFDRVLAWLPPASVRYGAATTPTLDLFREGNAAIIEAATELAAGGEAAVLAICSPPGTRPPRVTDHFVELARAQGLRIIGVDPLGGRWGISAT